MSRRYALKKVYDIGPHTHRGISGHVTLEITDFASGDRNFQEEIHGVSKDRGPSINQLKQRFGGKTQGGIGNPFHRSSYHLDLSPWLHLDGERRLEIRWKFTPDHPVPPDDPNYPHPSQP